MDWIIPFYSKTGQWWGPAEHKITERDYKRVETIKRLYPSAKSVLELGAGYGNTAAACAKKGLDVVGIEISDRANFAENYLKKKYSGSFRIIKEDFYSVHLEEKFDVVTYWNGFGIGTDEDQKNLLKKIATWLKPAGVAMIDIANPLTWKRWMGEEQIKASPKDGYNYNLTQRIEYDEKAHRFIDTWWQTEKPEEKMSQSIRCYLPTEINSLVTNTGLQLERMYVRRNEFSADNYEQFLSNDIDNEYLIILKRNAP